MGKHELRTVRKILKKDPFLSKLDLDYHRGRLHLPTIVLIHGHGVSKKSWTNPLRESVGNSPEDSFVSIRFTTSDVKQPRFFRESLPQGSFLFTTVEREEKKREIVPFWELLRQEGYSLITWNQRHPNRTAHFALEEMERIFQALIPHPRVRDIIFLCHSRGGLVARKFIQSYPEFARKIKALIMLGTPNRGSMLATFAKKFIYFQKFTHFAHLARRFLPPLLQKKEVLQEFLDYLNRGVNFLKSEAVTELKFNSPFILSLKGEEDLEKEMGIPYYHLVGTRSQYDKIYYVPQKEDYVIEIPFVYQKLPSILLPWELVDGKGDGLVATYRARLGFEKVFEEHYVNHSELLMDTQVQQRILDILSQLALKK